MCACLPACLPAADLTALAQLIPAQARMLLDPGAKPGAAQQGGAAAAGPAVEEVLVPTSSVRVRALRGTCLWMCHLSCFRPPFSPCSALPPLSARKNARGKWEAISPPLLGPPPLCLLLSHAHTGR